MRALLLFVFPSIIRLILLDNHLCIQICSPFAIWTFCIRFKSSEVIKNTWRVPHVKCNSQHKKGTNFDKVASGAVHILFYDVSFYSLYWIFWVTSTLDTRYPSIKSEIEQLAASRNCDTISLYHPGLLSLCLFTFIGTITPW